MTTALCPGAQTLVLDDIPEDDEDDPFNFNNYEVSHHVCVCGLWSGAPLST